MPVAELTREQAVDEHARHRAALEAVQTQLNFALRAQSRLRAAPVHTIGAATRRLVEVRARLAAAETDAIGDVREALGAAVSAELIPNEVVIRAHAVFAANRCSPFWAAVECALSEPPPRGHHDPIVGQPSPEELAANDALVAELGERKAALQRQLRGLKHAVR